MEVVENCESCVDEIDEIESEIAKCITQQNITKQKYNDALIENLKYDLILHKLLNQEQKKKFEEFADQFSVETLDKLRTLDGAETNDSGFILAAVRDLYKDDLSVLKNKNYTGSLGKEAVSPEKKKILKDIFEKRFEYLNNNDEKRKKKFAAHVKHAIDNIIRAKK